MNQQLLKKQENSERKYYILPLTPKTYYNKTINFIANVDKDIKEKGEVIQIFIEKFIIESSLIIETLGPMGGYVNFTVKLQPSLPAGNYSIKRIIDIDPNNVWINYGQEMIGSFTILEGLSNYGIAVEKTGENNPGVSSQQTSNSQASSSSGGSSDKGGNSVTNVYKTYVTNGKNNESLSGINNEQAKKNKEIGITGGAVNDLLSKGSTTIVLGAFIGVFILIVVFKIKGKKK